VTFQVIWLATADAKLTQIWLGSRMRAEITQAANTLDRQLGADAQSVGESRGAGPRIAFEAPLAIRFIIDEANHRVMVLDVWEFGPTCCRPRRNSSTDITT
jgi:hypothetical protein